MDLFQTCKKEFVVETRCEFCVGELALVHNNVLGHGLVVRHTVGIQERRAGGTGIRESLSQILEVPGALFGAESKGVRLALDDFLPGLLVNAAIPESK